MLSPYSSACGADVQENQTDTSGVYPLDVLGDRLLDSMTDAEIDALPLGVIQVDGDGIIRKYNLFEAKLAGRRADEVIGHSFFNDIAPCTHLPDFMGRFQQGVREGKLDERFLFTFDFDFRNPTRVHIDMFDAQEDNRYWIVAAVDRIFTRQQPLKLSENTNNDVIIEGLQDACEDEPIHRPSAIQPWGALLVVDRTSRSIAGVSRNLSEILRIDLPGSMLGESIDMLFAVDVTKRIYDFQPENAPGFPPTLRFLAAVKGATERVDLRITASDHYWYIEISIAEPPDSPQSGARELLDQTEMLRRTQTVDTAAKSACDILRDLTGLQRVVIYQFDADWNGRTIAESLEPDTLDSLFGLHFPEGDIPRQARSLYRVSKMRMTPNRDYRAVPVVFAETIDDSATNLGNVHLRSVSPVHRLYHENIGVNGSMSMSIVIDGRLWGMVIGHHQKPHYLTTDQKMASSLIVDTLTSHLESLINQDIRERSQQERIIQFAILESLSATGDLVSATLQSAGISLRNLFGSSAAAVITDSGVSTIGRAPSETLIRQLVTHAREETEDSIWFSSCLSDVFPRFSSIRKHASGAIIAFPSQDATPAIVWFLPERIQIHDWAGHPGDRRIGSVEGRLTYLPRQSFQRWTEITEGHCREIEPFMLDIADNIGAAVGEFLVRRSQRLIAMSQQVEASYAQLSAVLNSMAEAVIGINPDQSVTLFNRGATDIYVDDDIETDTIRITDILTKDAMSLLAAFLDNGRPVVGARITAKRRSGMEFPADLSLGSWDKDGERMLVMVLADKSDRVLLEARETERNKLEALGQIAGSVAHDFNNFLSIISGNLELVTLMKDFDQAKKRIDEARHAVRRGAELTDRLLGLVRKQSAQPMMIDVATTILREKAMLETIVGSTVTLVLDLEDKLPALRLQPGLLENAVINLLTNARDAMSSGGSITITARSIEFERQPAVHISVSDTGHGMDEDTRDRALTPFFTTKKAGKGTGLGLSTVNRLVETCRGNVHIDSREGCGTTIHLILPGHLQGDGDSPVQAEGFLPLRGKVLIVDDEKDVLHAIRDILIEQGYSVIATSSVMKARKYLDSDTGIQVLLTDIVMRGKPRGISLGNQARERDNIDAVIGMTGDPGQLDAPDQMAFPLLAKPFEYVAFQDVLSNLMHSAVARPE